MLRKLGLWLYRLGTRWKAWREKGSRRWTPEGPSEYMIYFLPYGGGANLASYAPYIGLAFHGRTQWAPEHVSLLMFPTDNDQEICERVIIPTEMVDSVCQLLKYMAWNETPYPSEALTKKPECVTKDAR